MWAAVGGESEAFVRQLNVWPAGEGAQGVPHPLAGLLDSLAAQT